MKMKRIIAALMFAVVCSMVVLAVPAKRDTFVHVQSDGSTVTLMMQGGKFNHCYVTLDGLTVAQNDKGDFCYQASGMLSSVLAHDKDSRGIEETAFVQVYSNQMTLAAQQRRIPRREEVVDERQVPCMGSPKIPIILVNYQDVKFVSEDPLATFENQFNEKEYSSLHYFESQSRGQFSPQFDILGPVELDSVRSFYGANDGYGYDKQLGTMVVEACEGLPEVDFSDYDNNNDGYVDVIVVLFAGVGEAQASRTVPESVWPCQWDMQECYDWGYSTKGPFELNGVIIDKFAVFNELKGSSNAGTAIDGVGTFCHEFGHCLGLPDFYPTNDGSGYGMHRWDIMDYGCYNNGGETPVGYTSYERHFMGWMDYIEPEENNKYTLPPLNTDEGQAVKVVNDANEDEYYLLEYRVKTGWDAYLDAEGIMIIHVDYDQWAWENNSPNNNSAHQRMTIIPADNRAASGTNSTDLWPLGGLDSLTNNSTPAATVYAGGYMNKPITGMAISQDGSSASLWYMKASAIVGDVNNDGEVNIADINVIISIILGNLEDFESDILESADVNGDGEITISDINEVVDIILSA